MKKILIIGVIVCFFLSSCKGIEKSASVQTNQDSTQQKEANLQVTNKSFKDINFKAISKIGIISVIGAKDQKRYIETAENIIESKKDVEQFIAIIEKYEVNENIYLDRLPGEYKINIYFEDGKRMVAYYWIKQTQYNLHIEGVRGEITVNSNQMDKLITTLVNEPERERNVDPY